MSLKSMSNSASVLEVGPLTQTKPKLNIKLYLNLLDTPFKFCLSPRGAYIRVQGVGSREGGDDVP